MSPANTTCHTYCFRYYSRCTFQHSGQELIDGLKVCMKGIHLWIFKLVVGELVVRLIVKDQGSISQRVRTNPNLGLVLGDIKIGCLSLSYSS